MVDNRRFTSTYFTLQTTLCLKFVDAMSHIGKIDSPGLILLIVYQLTQVYGA